MQTQSEGRDGSPSSHFNYLVGSREESRLFAKVAFKSMSKLECLNRIKWWHTQLVSRRLESWLLMWKIPPFPRRRHIFDVRSNFVCAHHVVFLGSVADEPRSFLHLVTGNNADVSRRCINSCLNPGFHFFWLPAHTWDYWITW